ncbi:MAG: copper transporter [Actinomycetota bacterium]
MLDMRYHVISLVAVFLALGIGILLGTTLVERGLVGEQRAEIKSLKQTFEEIKEKNVTLNEQLVAYQEFARQAKPYLVTGALAGRSYVIVARTDPEEKALASINEGLQSAGASVPATVLFAGSAQYSKPEVTDSLATLFQMPGANPQQLKERVYAEVVNQMLVASNLGILDTLQETGVIQVRGAITGPVTGAALLGSIETTKLEENDIPLIRTFIAAALPLVGVGGSETAESVMVAYKKTGISTVDPIDDAPGQVALVMVFNGRSGNYGSGKSATRMIPEYGGI